jgi:hypothetical protein
LFPSWISCANNHAREILSFRRRRPEQTADLEWVPFPLPQPIQHLLPIRFGARRALAAVALVVAEPARGDDVRWRTITAVLSSDKVLTGTLEAGGYAN